MTLKVLADPSQLNPVSFWPSTVLLSVWMICNGSTHQNQSHSHPSLTQISTESGLKQTQKMCECSDPHLYVDLVICGSVDGAVETKPNHKYPSVHREPEKTNRN